MKTRLMLLFVAVSILFVSKINAQDAATVVLDKAFAEAKKENKNVMVLFTASWCKWCKKMEKDMYSEACKDLFTKNYIITKLVTKESKRNKYLENPGAEEILQKYNAEKLGVPFVLFFDKEGKMIAKNVDNQGTNLGCPSTEREVHFFKKNLKKTSSLTDAELKTIEDRFIIKK